MASSTAVRVQKRAYFSSARGVGVARQLYVAVCGWQKQSECPHGESRRPVGTQWIVAEGLKQGERVVVEGCRRCVPGMR